MVSASMLSLALFAGVALAYPGVGQAHNHRSPRHRHQHRRLAEPVAVVDDVVAKRAVTDDDGAVVVYETVMVTEFVTYTQTSDAAGQLTTTALTVDALTTAAVTSTAATSPLASVVAQLAALTAVAQPATTSTPATTLAVATSTTPAAAVVVPTTSSTTTPAAVIVPTSSTVAAPATTSTTPTTTTANSGTSTLKRGLAWPSENAVAAGSVFASHASSLGWYHNWGTGSTSSLSSIPFVYTQWGPDNLQNLASLPSGSILVGPNEPEVGAQSNLSPATVAALYRNHMTPLRKSGKVARLGSPACSNTDAGLAWLKSFLALCSDCEIDFITQHWYGPTVTMLQSQLGAVHALDTSKPIWITEFACTNWVTASNPTQDAIAGFMKDSMAWMEATSWIERYSWFGALHITDANLGAANMLVTADLTTLSNLGKQYLGLA